jgi:hypothetical protein
MCKYKISYLIKCFVLTLFIFPIVQSCTSNPSDELNENPNKNIYLVETEQEAGLFVSSKQSLLPAPFNLVKISTCTDKGLQDEFSKGILLHEAFSKGSQCQARLVYGMRYKSRASNKFKIVPVFIPLKNSKFKYLPADQFRLKYDEMIQIVQNWYWNYLDYRDWSFDTFVTVPFIQNTVKPCFDLKED